MNYKVADLKLAEQGRLRIEWAESRMPVLMALREKGKKDRVRWTYVEARRVLLFEDGRLVSITIR